MVPEGDQAATDRSSVAERLALGKDHERWLDVLEKMGPPAGGVSLPTGEDASVLLRRLGVEEADLPVLLDARPSPESDPELWWLLERAAHLVRRDVGNWDVETATWPPLLPEGLGSKGRCFWVYVFVAAVDDIRRWHTERGVPSDVSWATLADLGRSVARHRRNRGTTGLDNPFWLSAHYRGLLYKLGRLQFNPHRLCTFPAGPLFWYDAETLGRMGLGFQPGDPALGVHIPMAGPLEPRACDDSIAKAKEFFARHFPEHRYRIMTCTSWLLDDQLAEYLPSTSNIIRFQRRFQLVPGARDNDDEIFRFVFGREPESLDELPQGTDLERAVVRHVREGGHWRVRSGWFEP